MKERPILMSAPMVRASLDDTKTQTRRVVKPQPPADKQRAAWYEPGVMGWAPPEVPSQHWHRVRCPYGQPGDRLWVRETWNRTNPGGDEGVYYYRADTHFPASIGGGPIWSDALWRPSIFMPRAASRITLEVTGVRVERLQDISTADAEAEGWPGPDAENSISSTYPIAWYSKLWEQINGPESWAANPWVWVIEFKRLEAAC